MKLRFALPSLHSTLMEPSFSDFQRLINSIIDENRKPASEFLSKIVAILIVHFTISRISEKHFQHDHETKAIWYSYPPDPILSVNYQQIIISTGKHSGGEKCEAGDIMYYEKNYKGSLTTKSELTVTSNEYLWKTETCQTLYKHHINGG